MLKHNPGSLCALVTHFLSRLKSLFLISGDRSLGALNLSLFFFFASQVSLFSQQIVLNKLFIAVLTPFDFGMLSAWLISTTFAAILIPGPLSSAAVRFISQHPGSNNLNITNQDLFAIFNSQIVRSFAVYLLIGLVALLVNKNWTSIPICLLMYVLSYLNGVFILRYSVINAMLGRGLVLAISLVDTIFKVLSVYLFYHLSLKGILPMLTFLIIGSFCAYLASGVICSLAVSAYAKIPLHWSVPGVVKRFHIKIKSLNTSYRIKFGVFPFSCNKDLSNLVF